MTTEINSEILVNGKTALGSTTILPTTPGPGLSGITTTTVRQPVNTANAILKEADPNRVGLSVFNSSPAGRNMFVKLGASAGIGAGTESFTHRLVPGGYWEIPGGYTGRVDAIWDGADANGEALITESFLGFTPLSLSGYQLWLRGDQGLLDGAAIPYWVDSSGLGRSPTQATGAAQPSQVAGVINGKPVVRWGPTEAGRYMDFPAGFNQSLQQSVYAVVRFRSKSGDYQIFMHDASAAGVSHYLGGNDLGSSNDKPMMYTNQENALWSSALVDATNHLVRWSRSSPAFGSSQTHQFYTQVDDGTEVNTSQLFTLTNPPAFTRISFVVLGTQDLISDIAELVIYNRILALTEQQQLWDYWNTEYALF